MNKSGTKRIKLHPSHESQEFEEFSRLVQRRLEETGLLASVDEAESCCLENGSQFFVEFVLLDGSLIQQGEALVVEFANTFKQRYEHIRVQGVVRAHWTVGDITDVGYCQDESGLPRSAECFKVELEAGKGRQTVEVEVVPSAFEEIERSLGVGEQFVHQVIRKLLEHDLSKGGLSFWHPGRDPKQQLNQIAAHAMIYEIKNPK